MTKHQCPTDFEAHCRNLSKIDIKFTCAVRRQVFFMSDTNSLFLQYVSWAT